MINKSLAKVIEEQLWKDFAEEEIDCVDQGLPIPTYEQKYKAIKWALTCLAVMGPNTVVVGGYTDKGDVCLTIRDNNTQHRCSMVINNYGYPVTMIWLDKDGNVMEETNQSADFKKVESSKTIFSGEISIPAKDISRDSRIFIDIDNKWFEEND